MATVKAFVLGNGQPLFYQQPEFMRSWTPWYKKFRLKQAAEEAHKICKSCTFTPKPESDDLCLSCSFTLKVLICQQNGEDFRRTF